MPGILIIALPFAVLGGLMASLITYNEMQHHFDHSRATMEAAKTGIIAFAFLVLLSLVVAAIVPTMTR